MKAWVFVTPKPDVLDPQGKAIQRACGALGHPQVTAVRQGKLFELELEGVADPLAAERLVRELAQKLLSNPVIEDFEIDRIQP